MIQGRTRLAGLQPLIRQAAEYALAVAEYYGVPVTVTSGFRSWEDQQRLRTNYEQCLASGNYGKTQDCKYPANRPGDSSHNWGLGFDSWVPAEYQPAWTYIREAIGFRVPPNDVIHAELPGWRDYVQGSPGPLS